MENIIIFTNRLPRQLEKYIFLVFMSIYLVNRFYNKTIELHVHLEKLAITTLNGE